MAEAAYFSYSAIDGSGRRVKGVVLARDDAAAFDKLRREGLAPISLRPRRRRQVSELPVQTPGERESAEFLSSLADLLAAGADIRTSLGILGQRSDRSIVRNLSQRLAADIGGGESLERAFGRSFLKRQAFVGSLVAAGEAAGDLPEGLQRAAEIISSRLRLKDQLVSVAAYPAFVFASAVGALFVILMFIVPSIAPLAEEGGATPSASLRVMIAASDLLRSNLGAFAAAGGVGVGLLLVTVRLGFLSRTLERLILDGPLRRTTRAIVFGGFAMSLGSMLSAGAPITDALRLAIRSVGSKGARRRLEPVLQAVREGQTLSYALGDVKGFPHLIIRLAAVGEASNALGQMLTRGGTMEEDAALRRIEVFGRVAGPALIVMLGVLLGVLMGGLLTGVSQMGQSALR
jgi:type II secretory pathway component PulF